VLSPKRLLSWLYAQGSTNGSSFPTQISASICTQATRITVLTIRMRHHIRPLKYTSPYPLSHAYITISALSSTHHHIRSQAHITIHHHSTHTSSYPLSRAYIIICALSHGWLNISCTYVKNCIIIALSQRAQPFLCLSYYPRLLVIAGKNVEIWDCESPAPGPAPVPPPPGPAPPGPAPSSGKCCNVPCTSSTECASQLFC
jgi:hypothetical protein